MSETGTLRWEIDHLVKAGLFPNEQAVVRSALRALYASQPMLRRQMVIRACTAGEISLGKAAELLGVSPEEMTDILREEGAETHPGPQATSQLLREAAQAYGKEVTQGEILRELRELDSDRWSEVLDFIGYLKSTSKSIRTQRKELTARELLQSGLVGMWADRDDIDDSLSFAGQLRQQAEHRHWSTDDPA
jgi:predicted HTH domain antitoxin